MRPTRTSDTVEFWTSLVERQINQYIARSVDHLPGLSRNSHTHPALAPGDAESAFRLVLTEQTQIVAVNVGIAPCGAFVLAENVAKRVRHTNVAFLADQISDILLEEALRL